jgi:hypothetical protein
MTQPKFRNFPTCHCHQASLDTASTPEAFAEKELELGTGYLTVTDHGTLQAARRVYDLAKKKNLTPIIGLEAYLRDDNCPILLKHGFKPEHPVSRKGEVDTESPKTLAHYAKYFHLSMTFLDAEAYETGVRLLSKADSRAEKHGSEKKPLFTWDDIEELGSKNVTMTSSCLVGVVQRHLIDHDNIDIAIDYYEKLRGSCRPGNWYVEVFPHKCDKNWDSTGFVTFTDGVRERFQPWKKLKFASGVEGQVRDFDKRWKVGRQEVLVAVMENRKWAECPPRTVQWIEVEEGFVSNDCRPWAEDGDVQRGANMAVLALAQRYGDPVLIGDDSHYAQADEKVVQDIRLQSGGGSWRFYGQYHRQSSQEAYEHFKATGIVSGEAEFEGWVENSLAWGERFKGFTFNDRKSLPTKFYPEDTLAHTLSLVEKHGRMRWNDPVWVERLEREIEMLHQNGSIDLLPYFFLGEEVCDYFGQQKKLTGPGRGSAAGMLLAYLLRITHVNPIQYGLSMERFLTATRIRSGKLPDIDQDLSRQHRDLLINPETGYLRQRFGDHYARISTDTSLKLKSAIKDVARVTHNGRVPEDTEMWTRKMQVGPQGISDYDFVFGYKDSSDNWVEGSIESDPNLQEYTKRYPLEWKVVQQCLGLTRNKSLHACLPASEHVRIVGGAGILPITECDGKDVYTGQGEKRGRGFAEHAKAKLLPQGMREVFEYQLERGRVIRCTPDHKVLTTTGWMTMQEAFESGAELQKPNVRWKSSKQDAERYASRRGGRLVEWGGATNSVSKWECDKGHTWTAKAGQLISYEYWCRKCCHHFRRDIKSNKSTSPIRSRANKQLKQYMRCDLKNGFAHDLTVDDVIRAKGCACTYCGRAASGMDRIDNSVGHTKANCVPACLRCNWMRGRYISHETMLQVGALLEEIDP